MQQEANHLVDLIQILKERKEIVDAAEILRKVPTFERSMALIENDSAKKITFLAIAVLALHMDSKAQGDQFIATGANVLAFIHRFPEMIYFNLSKPSEYGAN